MRTRGFSAIHTLAFVAFVGSLLATPAAASTITINGGALETIDIACNPCRGGTGLPLGIVGYSAETNPGVVGLAPMSLVLDQASLVRFTFMGLDTDFHNAFYVDQDGDTDPFDDPVVFDLPRARDEAWPVRPSAVFALPAGIVHFGYRYNIDVNNVPVNGSPSLAFNVFAACLPQPSGTNPRTCTQGYLGFADGQIFIANDDHQDLGVMFEVQPVPEPMSLVLTSLGLIAIARVARRRNKSVA